MIESLVNPEKGFKMRIVLILFVCCLTGCSSFEMLGTDLSLAPPKGKIELISLAIDGDSMQVTKSNSLALDGVGHFDLPLGEYYGLGINEDDDATLHGGLTYRSRANVSFFIGASLNTDDKNSLGLEYGTQYLMKDFSFELRRDEENDLTLLGIGKEF